MSDFMLRMWIVSGLFMVTRGVWMRGHMLGWCMRMVCRLGIRGSESTDMRFRCISSMVRRGIGRWMGISWLVNWCIMIIFRFSE